MGRLTKHLNEYVSAGFSDTSIDEIMVIIEKDCKKYMKQLGFKTPLYRASNLTGDMGKAVVRTDRRPSGLHIYGQRGWTFLNNWLDEHGMAARDSSIMCTPNRNHAKMFSKGRKTRDIYYVFPSDAKFKWAYCEHMDFNFDPFVHDALKFIDPKKRAKSSMPTYRDLSQEEAEKKANEYLSNFIKNKNFNEAYTKGYEIWYECKDFYYISASEYDLRLHYDYD